MTAAQDRLSPQYDIRPVGITETVDELKRPLASLCSTRVLLGRPQDQPDTHHVSKISDSAEGCLSGESTCEIFAAKTQHVLRSLRQIALDAILRHSHNVAEDNFPPWRYRWRYSKRTGEDWFTEWPNSRRPLSTTWPWNIKPSLVVLWGVCWMFYGPSGNDNKKRAPRNPRGAAPSTEDLSAGRFTSQSQASQPSQQSINFRLFRQPNHDCLTDGFFTGISGAWAGPSSNTYPDDSWLHPTRAAVARRAKSDPERESYNAQSDDPSL